jgi:hypothetical protein
MALEDRIDASVDTALAGLTAGVEGMWPRLSTTKGDVDARQT